MIKRTSDPPPTLHWVWEILCDGCETLFGGHNKSAADALDDAGFQRDDVGGPHYCEHCGPRCTDAPHD